MHESLDQMTKNKMLSLIIVLLSIFVSTAVFADERYTGVWRAGTDSHFLWSGVGWDNFVSKWKELDNKGLRLIDIEIYQ